MELFRLVVAAVRMLVTFVLHYIAGFCVRRVLFRVWNQRMVTVE